jgi:hypothetical protein
VHRKLHDSDRLLRVFDLGATPPYDPTPPCAKLLTADKGELPEPTFPLHLRLYEDRLLLQIPALITAQPSDSSVARLTCTIAGPIVSRTVIRSSTLPGSGHRKEASWPTPHSRTGCLARSLLPAPKCWLGSPHRERSFGQTIRIATEDEWRATWGRL